MMKTLIALAVRALDRAEFGKLPDGTVTAHGLRADYSRGWPAKSLPDHQAHQAMDETAEWARDRLRIAQAIKRTAMQAGEDAKNQRAAAMLEAMPTASGRMLMRWSDDDRVTAKGQAPYFWHPLGSMGEEAPAPGYCWTHNMHPSLCGCGGPGDIVASMPRDPHCSMERQCPGALGKGCYLCEPGPFDGIGVPSYPLVATPEGDRGPAADPCYRCGAECNHMPCPNGCPLGTQDDADRAELERINSTRRPTSPVRTTPFGSEPWDLATGEAS